MEAVNASIMVNQKNQKTIQPETIETQSVAKVYHLLKNIWNPGRVINANIVLRGKTVRHKVLKVTVDISIHYIFCQKEYSYIFFSLKEKWWQVLPEFFQWPFFFLIQDERAMHEIMHNISPSCREYFSSEWRVS